MMDFCDDQDHESLSLHNKKRDSDVAKNDERKKLVKRRSSLAASRRSITGLKFEFDSGSDLPSSCSSTASSDSDNHQKKLPPNPLNIRMDEIIQQFEESISRSEQEYKDWKAVLINLKDENQNSQLLVESNDPIVAEDIPQELKDLARSEYVTSELIDHDMLEARVEKSCLRKHFNIIKCAQDMKLMRDCVNTIKCHNKIVQDSRSGQTGVAGPFSAEATVQTLAGVSISDDRMPPTSAAMKEELEWLMKN